MAKSEDGPVDTERTFEPSGRYKKFTILDDLTTTVGRAILWYNSVKFYIPLPDLVAALPAEHEDVVDLVEEELDDKESVEEPEPSESPPAINMEEVNAAYQRVLKLFKEEGDMGLDSLLAGKSWLFDALDLSLKKGAEGREERAATLAETLDDSTAPASMFLALYGNK